MRAHRFLDFEKNRSFGSSHYRGRSGKRKHRPHTVMAGLVPAIHVYGEAPGPKYVDARHEAGHDEKIDAQIKPRHDGLG